MKTDIITVVILVFCVGVFTSALASSELFSTSDSAPAVVAQAQE
jgi:hypothetical protein